MKLAYIGPPVVNGIVPLPEGYPAATHYEPDETRGEEKLASGFYREWVEGDPSALDPADNDRSDAAPAND